MLEILFYSDKASKDAKHKKETEARKEIEKAFKEFKALTQLINDYEKRKDQESEFVYALDKILPVMNIYLDEGRSWREHNIEFDMLVENKNKVIINKDVADVWEELVRVVEMRKEQLFGEKN